MRDTSFEAWKSVDPGQVKSTKDRILQALAHAPMTDEEILEHIGGEKYFSPSGVRTARCQLEKDGFLFDSGQRKLTKRKRKAIVWTLEAQAKLF